jgi:hypothetical protein
LYVDLSAGSAIILHTTFAEEGLAAGAVVYVVTGTVGITYTFFASHWSESIRPPD